MPTVNTSNSFKMINKKPVRIRTISDFHRLRSLPPPQHPLISVVDIGAIKAGCHNDSLHLILDFYAIFIKRDLSCRLKYGQQQYDFDKGVMCFIAPDQLYGVEVYPNVASEPDGWMLL